MEEVGHRQQQFWDLVLAMGENFVSELRAFLRYKSSIQTKINFTSK